MTRRGRPLRSRSVALPCVAGPHGQCRGVVRDLGGRTLLCVCPCHEEGSWRVFWMDTLPLQRDVSLLCGLRFHGQCPAVIKPQRPIPWRLCRCECHEVAIGAPPTAERASAEGSGQH
jgi:hypothetical protein